MTERTCPKCNGIMKKAGRIRRGKLILQKYACARLSGCGYIQEIKQEETK